MPIHTIPETAAALGGPQLPKCESRSLLKDKFVLFDTGFDEAKQVSMLRYLPHGQEGITKLRNSWQRELQKNQRPGGGNARSANAEAGLKAAPEKPSVTGGFPVLREWLSDISKARRHTFRLQTSSRLLVGLANGVLENAGCMIHPRFGFPFIPGSALKGVARDAAAILRKSPDEIRFLFGNRPEECDHPRQGAVAFLDAFAVGNSAMELDVTTPHFWGYYSGSNLNPKAMDTESPTPIPFPAVAEGVDFEFAMLVHGFRLSDEEASDALKTAGECLQYALQELGVGAKTASGHGRFRSIQPTQAILRNDLFPPPPKPVLAAHVKVLDAWKGKTIGPMMFSRLVPDLLSIEDAEKLAEVFDQIMPPQQLGNYRAANPFWKEFIKKPGATELVNRMKRPLA